MRQIKSLPVGVDDLLAIALSAGRAIMDVYRAMQHPGSAEAMAVTLKADDSPLTLADLAAHRVIAQGLAELTPHIPVVSEEDASSWVHRRPVGVFWLIDPLDGTKEFLARNDEFTVNIALIDNGVAVFGVVVAPALDQSYWGGQGRGACRRINQHSEPIRVSRPVDGAQHPLRVVASKSHLNAETIEFVAQLGPHELVQAGSSLKFCRIAEGAAEVYPRLGPTCEWDTAAGHAIVEAAGGQVCSLDGSVLRYGKTDLINPHFVASAWPMAGVKPC